MRLPATVLLIAWVAMGCNRDLRHPAPEGGGGPGGMMGAVATGTGGSVIDATGGAGDLGKRDAADGATSAAAEARYLFIFYSPHGTILDAWRPSGSGANFTLSRILSPLAEFQDRMTVIDGLDNVSAPGQLTSTHIDGPRLLLTARATGGPSIDSLFLTPGHSQVAAGGDVGAQDEMSASTVTPTLINYDPSRGVPILPFINARQFAASFLPDAIPLQRDPDPNDMLDTTQTFFEIATQAVGHDDTRAVTLLWALLNGPIPAIFGGTVNQMAEASATAPDNYIGYQVTISQELRYLVSLIERITIAPGVSLLDRSLVMWISETGEASSHSGHAIPVVLIGNLGGALRTGQYLHYANRTQGDLMLTLARVAGAATFGDPAIATAPLTELLAP